MSPKTEQLLMYIAQHYSSISITSFIKLSYLIDLISIQKNDKKISDFDYIRYYYGPFDKSIYEYLKSLTETGVLQERVDYTPSGEEYIMYNISPDFKHKKSDLLNDSEILLIDQVINELKGFGPKVLTEIAYKTKPMQALNATLGGNENMNKKLNLFLK